MNDFDDDQFSDGLAGPFDSDLDDDLDEIIVDDEYTENNRSFPLAVLGLLGALVATLVCLGIYLLVFPNDTEDPEIAEANSAVEMTSTVIAATNEAIATQNSFVTATLMARTLTASAPTETSTPAPTEPPTETPTPVPTSTPQPNADVVGSSLDSDGENGDGSAESSTIDGVEEAVADAGTGGGDAADDVSQEAAPATGGTTSDAADAGSTDAPAAVGDATAELPETLPETGISLAGAIAAALALAAIFFFSRRLRTQL